MGLRVAIERNLARPVRPVGGWCFAEERLGGSDAAIRPQEKIDRLAVLGNRPPKAALTCSSGCDAQLWHFREQVPGQQLFDLINRMIGDVIEDVTQVAFGVEIVEFRGAE